MKKIIFSLALLLSGGMLASCNQVVNGMVKASVSEANDHDYKDSKERGPVVERALKVKSFDELDLGGRVKVVYTQGKDTKVTLRGNEKDLAKYETCVKDGELKISLKDKPFRVNGNSPRLTAIITAPALKGVDVSGACVLEMPERVNLDCALDIEVSGAVDMKAANLEVQSLDLDVSGAAGINLDRLVARQDADIEVSGAGDVKGNIKARGIEVDLSGAGDVSLTVDCDDLRCDVSGAGDFTVKGKCRTFSKSKSGTASVNSKKLKVTGK